MKTICALLSLLVTVPAAAQPLVVHEDPQGVTAYASPADWPWMTGQGHWKATGAAPNPVGPLVPGIAHTHTEGHFPIWAELGAGPITVPISFKLFQTAGHLAMIQADFLGPEGPVRIPTIFTDRPLPLVGDPNGLVSVDGHLTFDPAVGFAKGAVVPHGWFNIRIFTRTGYSNGDTMDTEFIVPFFSVLDPSVPEPHYAEGVQNFSARAVATTPFNTVFFGTQLTEFRGSDRPHGAYLPILAPFNTPKVVFPLTYNYANLFTLFPSYELRLDPNFHMGIAGQLIASTATNRAGGISNVDTLDPVVIAASTPPMGATPGKHRLFFLWNQDTGAGSPGYAPNERLTTIVGVEVAIGENPVPADPPPAPTCQDPKATNVGGPLPCVFPVVIPPPPPPLLTVFTFTCDPAGKCVLVVK